MMPSRLPPGADRVPILGQKPRPEQLVEPRPIPVPVVAAFGGGSSAEQAEASALAQVGASGVNVLATPMVVFLPALCFISAPENPRESVLGALGITAPSHPLWGHNLRALVAQATTDDPATWVAASIGWIQAIVAPNAPPFGGVMVGATYRAPTQDEARDRVEERMDAILRRTLAEREMPQPASIQRVTAVAGIDETDLDQDVTTASALVLAAFSLEAWR